MSVAQPRELRVALQAARAADRVLMRYWRNVNPGKTKSNWRDPVTRADVESDKTVRGIIHRAFPSHDILTEESGQTNRGSDWLWVIDPLDGTVNFTLGLPTFTVSIGLLYRNQPFLGVVSAPALEERYWSVRGHGAFFQGKRQPRTRLHASTTKTLKHAAFSIGFGYSNAQRERFLAQFPALLFKSRAARIHYSGAYDFMNVARGGFDFYFNYGLGPWDYAAAWTIVHEAGGHLLTTAGKPIRMGDANIVAINGPIKRSLFTQVIP